MHIAFFNRSYFPDQTATGQLLTELCESLVSDHGHAVTVVTGPPLADAAGRRPVVPSREYHRGVRIVRAWGTRYDKRRFAGRAANYVSYFGSAAWLGVRLPRPDVVVALTDPPIVGVAAWLAARRAGAPLVMAFKDLFPEVAALLPDFHSPAINATLQGINRWLVRRAAVNVALGETMRRRLIEDKGAPPGTTTIIADWADTDAIAPGGKDNPFSRAHGLVEAFVVMHSGNMGLSQNLETIVDAATMVREEPDVRFVFQGDGVSKARLEALVAARGLSNVTFLPFAPKPELADAFATADVFLVSLQQGLAGYIVPSKLYGILAAGRPYIAAVEPECEVAALTRQHDCGIVTPPGDARALAEAVQAFARDRARARQAGERARFAAQSFSRRGQVAKYDALFSRLVASRVRGADERRDA